eukprot:CAMPEP_0169426082 /NCGR_PEP_ID=MMETSP1017-20121227/68904_1 /TAXON_ID=342587 /ORGANISM="Karlodinium micrum, Strain CCMP2283" /LENGTH=671 /DNA_ID=CAMNT_0009535949 /DNA_START=101 /DNA_END=2116 /DNA_ORIENTATION=-
MRGDTWSQQGNNDDYWAKKSEALEAKWARKAENKKLAKAEREAEWLLAGPLGQKWLAEEQAKKAAVKDMASTWECFQGPPFRSDFLGRYAPDNVEAANDFRRALGIEVQSDPTSPGLTPAPLQSWSDLPCLPFWMAKSMQEHKWETPMPVQAQAIPILLAGRNLIGIAQTGSGKTVAFMVPAIIQAHDQRSLGQNDKGPIVLVLAPTRELAVQISEEGEKLLKYSYESPSHPGGLRSVCFYGGGKKWDQLKQFTDAGSHIVVATPGRLLDCVGEGYIPLSRVTYFCLDEADRMLDMGFVGDMENLSSTIRPDRQMAFFSATWPKEVQSLAQNLSKSGEPVMIRVLQAGKEHTELLSAKECIHQQVIVVDEPEGRGKWDRQDEIKKQLLDTHIKQVLASDTNAKLLIFVNQKTFADELANQLWNDNVRSDTIHGGKKQDLRLAALDNFRKGDTRVLIATDVVGRGLDIPLVSHVVVYSMGSVQDYIHRIGRTGRGKNATGHALVFFEYMPKQPEIAGELVDVLIRSGQVVPPELQLIADEVKSGKREDPYKQWNSGGNWKSGGSDWNSSGGDWKNGWDGGSDWKSTNDWKTDSSGKWQSSPPAIDENSLKQDTFISWQSFEQPVGVNGSTSQIYQAQPQIYQANGVSNISSGWQPPPPPVFPILNNRMVVEE